MNQPPIRYRSQQPNWPPPGSGPDPVYANDPGGKGPNWFRIALIGAGALFAVVLVLALVASMLGGDSEKPAPKPIAQKQEKPKPRPTSWSRYYGVRLQFKGKPTDINSVQASGLNQKEARIMYDVTGPCGGWIVEPRRWVMSVNPRSVTGEPMYRYAKSIKKQSQQADSCSYQVLFSWPTRYTRSARMTVRMNNGKRASDNITLWLQIPQSRQGVGELGAQS